MPGKYILLAALLTLAVFFYPYRSVIVLSALMAFLMLPIQNWFEKGRWHLSKGTSATLSLLASILFVAIPLIFVAWVAITQATHLVDSLQLDQLHIGSETFYGQLSHLVDSANQWIENLAGLHNAISVDEVQNFVTSSLPHVVNAFFNLIASIVQGLPNLVVSLILYIYLFSAVLVYRKPLLKATYAISPFDNKITKHMLSRVEAMPRGMVVGQGVIALCQGLVASLSLMILGWSEYFFVFFIILSFMSIIPLGAGIITIPIGLIAILAGNLGGGLLILLVHFLLVTNIDNVLRPLLVPKAAKLPAALIMLSAFAGVYYFGFLGVIFGPVLAIVIVSVIQVYVQDTRAKPAA